MKHLAASALSCAMFVGLVTLVSTPQQAAAAKLCRPLDKPVCALNRDGTRSTYGNICLANNARARVLHVGPCLGPICFMVWMPVCALNPATHKPMTYSNLCWAQNANAIWLYNGECRH
jgi:hypothetical protein